MRTLTGISIVSVLCAVLMWMWVLPQLLTNKEIDLDHLAVVMIALPTPVGLIAALAGAMVGIAGFVRSTSRTLANTLMTLGQILTWILAIAIVVWANVYGSTGWELLLVPASLMLGQTLVVSGLILAMRGGRRVIGPESREGNHVA